jgi:arginyl-tRNA synthetase
MKSILRKAKELGQASSPLLAPGAPERELMLRLLALPEALQRTASESLPHVLCEYAFELCGSFSSFYQSSSIIHEKDEAKRGSWLNLTEKTLQTLVKVLEILGLDAPERM